MRDAHAAAMASISIRKCDESDQNAVTGGYYRRRCNRIVLVELWGGAT